MNADPHHAQAADGTRIFWESSGAGDPPVVLCDGIGCAGYVWRRLAPDLARRGRVIHWNYRGHGRSARPADPARVRLADCVDDLLAVLDDAGAPSAILAGHSMGVQVVLEAHRRAPERVRGLVLSCGAAGRPLATFHDSGVLEALFPFLKAAVLARPDLARLLLQRLLPTRFALELGLLVEVNAQLLPREDLRHYLDDLASVDPEVFVRMLADAGAQDAVPHLARVDVPTLVIAGERDGFTPLHLSREMHDAIPGAELLVLPAGSHTGPLEHPELVSLRIEKFLRERLAAEPTGTATTSGGRVA